MHACTQTPAPSRAQPPASCRSAVRRRRPRCEDKQQPDLTPTCSHSGRRYLPTKNHPSISGSGRDIEDADCASAACRNARPNAKALQALHDAQVFALGRKRNSSPQEGRRPPTKPPGRASLRHGFRIPRRRRQASRCQNPSNAPMRCNSQEKSPCSRNFLRSCAHVNVPDSIHSLQSPPPRAEASVAGHGLPRHRQASL